MSQTRLVQTTLGYPGQRLLRRVGIKPLAKAHAKAQLGEVLPGVQMEGPPGDNNSERARQESTVQSTADRLRAKPTIQSETVGSTHSVGGT